MRLVFAAVALLTTRSAAAQILIGSVGNSATGTTGYVVYSLGETVIDTYDASANSFTYGFNQPIPGTIGVLENPSPSISVYPNPTLSFIEVEAQQGSSLVFYDEKKITCDLSALKAGSYTMRAQSAEGITNIKLVKI
jgi:hypothetical protein